jgi:hypothetical protein
MSMRLSRVGRVVYSLLALASLGVLVRFLLRGEWFGILAFGALTSHFGWAALSGKDPIARSRHGADWRNEP